MTDIYKMYRINKKLKRFNKAFLLFLTVFSIVFFFDNHGAFRAYAMDDSASDTDEEYSYDFDCLTGPDNKKLRESEKKQNTIYSIAMYNSIDYASMGVADGARDMPFSSLRLNYEYDPNGVSEAVLYISQENIFGGEVLANSINKATSSAAVIDSENKTVTFFGQDIRGKCILSSRFKDKNQYTLILYGRNNKAGGSRETNIRIEYTDGTNSGTSIKFESSSEDSFAVFSTPVNKTIKAIKGTYVEGSTKLYYERCGLFSGIVDPASMDRYMGQCISYDINSVTDSFYGGSIDFVAGKIISTKASDGTDIYPAAEFDIEPQYVTSFYGNNCFLSNADSIYAEYIADTRLLTKEAENGSASLKVFNPDCYEGTDSQKLQQCFDALANVGGNICITRTYVLTEDLVIHNDSENKRFITVYGLGKDAKIDCGSHRITGPHVVHHYGGIFWNNLQFYGTSVGFDAGILIRMWFSHCSFRGFTRAFSADGDEKNEGETNRYVQTLYLSDCAIKGCETAFYINGTGAYNMGLHSCLIENAQYGFNDVSGNMRGVRIDDCLWEGIQYIGIQIRGSGMSLTIDNNYFEDVGQCIFIGDYLTHREISIRHNYFVTSNKPAIFIEPTEKPRNNFLKGIIEGNTLYDNNKDSNPIVYFTTTPIAQQPWRLVHNYPNTVGNGARFVVGSNNILTDESDLDSAMIDGCYAVDGFEEIVQVVTAGECRVQIQYKKDNNEDLSIRFRVQDIITGSWSNWS